MSNREAVVEPDYRICAGVASREVNMPPPVRLGNSLKRLPACQIADRAQRCPQLGKRDATTSVEM